MAKKRTAGQKAAASKAKTPGTLAAVDKILERALLRLSQPAPKAALAKRAITNARKELRKACTLPPLQEK